MSTGGCSRCGNQNTVRKAKSLAEPGTEQKPAALPGTNIKNPTAVQIPSPGGVAGPGLGGNSCGPGCGRLRPARGPRPPAAVGEGPRLDREDPGGDCTPEGWPRPRSNRPRAARCQPRAGPPGKGWMNEWAGLGGRGEDPHGNGKRSAQAHPSRRGSLRRSCQGAGGATGPRSRSRVRSWPRTVQRLTVHGSWDSHGRGRQERAPSRSPSAPARVFPRCFELLMRIREPSAPGPGGLGTLAEEVWSVCRPAGQEGRSRELELGTTLGQPKVRGGARPARCPASATRAVAVQDTGRFPGRRKSTSWSPFLLFSTKNQRVTAGCAWLL